MPLLASEYGVDPGDAWSAWRDLGAVDRLDLTANFGDVRVQVKAPDRTPQPGGDGLLVRSGNFRSYTGLTQAYPPGPTAVRFKRGTVGAATSLDWEAWS